eukprot:CAMPEP_0117030960 /NCGR_PEP_ID=MMETSP0472-20121206/22306_1 /TAXON_ID=693140 ORGANISM="Tiarina fusus, Strain LIS" /NCGR_SAMPLE_ID=MMETSP0472 /ASSEMBLY_ACC=CAM_ASM_000603 /LENGTH=351 /DNA_ID=CAMNT_0004739183 /DNA_START=205 /DNA_END=1260 /DNA_ORIENTATION=-
MVRNFIVLLSTAAAVSGFATVPSFRDSAIAPPALKMVSSTSDGFADDFNDGLPQRRPPSGTPGSASSRKTRDGVKFVEGDALHQLRHEVLAMRLELQEARRAQNIDMVKELESRIMQAQQVDAEFVYTVALERQEIAEKRGQFQEAEKRRQQALEARSALPQFNLEGLWVGKYGDHGYEMINVTYQGDMLLAEKVTGTKNVPKGQATFRVDLSPSFIGSQEEVLEPIELGEGAAKQWGCRYLQRYSGEGQVAAEGYNDSQWVDGQLIMVNEYFSFAWLPIGHQVFFGRPTPELILRLMKDDKKQDTGDCSSRAHLERCWEETEYIEDDHEVNEGPFDIDQQDYYHQEGCFE